MNKPSLQIGEGRECASMRVYRALAIVAFLATFSAGCASNVQYAQFAQAGTVYASAVDRLLVTAGNVGIDATSEKLLMNDAQQNQDIKSYQQLSSVDEEYLKIISHLRTHARLLARYFGLLNELATSDAPERAQQAVGGVVNGLNALGQTLRGSGLVNNTDAFASVTKLVVGVAIRGMLKDELDKRKETIQVELKTQEELLKALSNAIQQDLTIINQTREQRLIIDPLVATLPVAKPDEWVAHRRMILTSRARVEELATASDAARKLREAFEGLVAGKFSLERVNALLTDLESILSVAEAFSR